MTDKLYWQMMQHVTTFVNHHSLYFSKEADLYKRVFDLEGITKNVTQLHPAFLKRKKVADALAVVDQTIELYEDLFERMHPKIRKAREEDQSLEFTFDDPIYRQMMDVFAESDFSQFKFDCDSFNNNIIRVFNIVETDKDRLFLVNGDRKEIDICELRKLLPKDDKLKHSRYLDRMIIDEEKSVEICTKAYVDFFWDRCKSMHVTNKVRYDMKEWYQKFNSDKMYRAIKKSANKVRKIPNQPYEKGRQIARGFADTVQTLNEMLSRYVLDDARTKPIIGALQCLEQSTQCLELEEKSDPEYVELVSLTQRIGLMAGQAVTEYQQHVEDKAFRRATFEMLDQNLSKISRYLSGIIKTMDDLVHVTRDRSPIQVTEDNN